MVPFGGAGWAPGEVSGRKTRRELRALKNRVQSAPSAVAVAELAEFDLADGPGRGEDDPPISSRFSNRKSFHLAEWERPKPGRRPNILPQFSPMKTPLPPPLPADPPEEDEEEEEKKEEDDPEKEEPDEPEKQP